MADELKQRLLDATTDADWNDVCGYMMRMGLAKACGRCGGCGRYSWNPQDRDTCYGCGGTGVRASTKVTAKLVAAYVERIPATIAEVAAERAERERVSRLRAELAESMTPEQATSITFERRGYDGQAGFTEPITVTCHPHQYYPRYTLSSPTCRNATFDMDEFRKLIRSGHIKPQEVGTHG